MKYTCCIRAPSGAPNAKRNDFAGCTAAAFAWGGARIYAYTPTGGCNPPQLDGYSRSSIRDVISIFTNTIIDNPFEEATLDCRHRSASNKLEVIPRKFQHWACRSGMRNLKSKQHQTNSVKFQLNTLTITFDYRI